MIKSILSITAMAGILLTLMGGCNKSFDTDSDYLPAPLDTASYLRFSISGIQLSGERLWAVFSMENKNGQPVVTNKKVTIDNTGGSFHTEKILVEKGEYRLSSFIVIKESDTALYATPKRNTEMAALVTTALAVDLAIRNKGINSLPVQVLQIGSSDSPSQYGYTSADFGYQPFISLFVKLKIKVGEVVYDSLPGRLIIHALNSQGQQWRREMDLSQGITSVRVPVGYLQYRFQVKKWNVSVERLLDHTELQPQMTMALEANRPAMRLTQETTYIESSSGLIPDSRLEYQYEANGRLSQIKNYQRSTIVNGLPLTNIYQFIYSGNQLDSIRRFTADNSLTGLTTFTYTGGKITGMQHKSYDQQTGASYDYHLTGNNGHITGDYVFTNGNSMQYRMVIRNGNRVSDQAQTSTGGNEGGRYEYDNNINPKNQLGWPDLFFTSISKNNLIKEEKSYVGAFPSAVPYQFEYAYDSNGYPVTVYISYRGYHTQQHLFRIRKNFSYQ